ncbi:MAG: hypothetical protein KF830_16190 [Planctomycetes bacterium]|nr:hypothetical protein [Planctomycetota bacterium]
MIGSARPSHQQFPAAAAFALLLAVAAGCGSSGGAAPNLPPVIVTAAFVGAGATPAAGETLQLFFSEDVELVAGALLTDTDVLLSGNATLGDVTAPPSRIGPRAVAVTLGAGVAFTPGTTTIAFGPGNDVVRDLGGAFGIDGAPVTIGTSDGAAPTLGNVTIAAIDGALNGTGPAGGTLQVPANGWTLDLAFSDSGTIDHTRTQITATVAVGTPAGSQLPGANLRPFLVAVATSNSAASYRVPEDVQFPNAPFTLTCVVVDASGLASAPRTFAATARAFTPALQPFETTVNAQQVWVLDFSRDVESFTTSAIAGGVSVGVVAGANGRSDYEDVLRVLGLQNGSPIPNVDGDLDSNAVVAARLRSELLADLAALYSGTKVVFTTTAPSGSFGNNVSLPYNQIGFSRISIAGSSTTAGVLGIALFDPSNATQNDNTSTSFQGQRLGVFLHTLAANGMGPPASTAFRLTFDPLAPSLGGVPVGGDASDGARLTGGLTDARSGLIDTAIAGLARFTAVVVAHECGHSMGLVRNGAMPVGLYGNDPVNFPGSTDGHIRTPSLFPSGATNVMSPSLSYSLAIHPATAFNRLNLAYLREQVFYGN